MRAVALIALTLTLGAPSQASAGDDPARSTAVIPLYVSQDRVLMMLRVGGKGPIPVVLDTGTTDNLLDSAAAETLGLPHVGPSTSIDGATGKPVPGYQTRLVGATISGVPLKDGFANVMDRGGDDDAGVFGPGSFAGRLVRLDLARRTLTLTAKSPATLPAGPPTPYLKIDDQDGLPATRVAIGALSFDAVVDIGNTGGLILPLAWAKKLTLERAPVADGQFASAGGTQVSYTARLRGKLRVGCLTLVNPQIDFMDGAANANVGIQILQRLSIVLDPEQQRSWFEGCPTRTGSPPNS